jgi:hypothetical protein
MRVYRASRHDLFVQLDQPALRPLPAEPFVFGEWTIDARVNIDSYIDGHGHYYSMPHALLHELVDARRTATTVEIFHPRSARGRAPPQRSPEPAHHRLRPHAEGIPQAPRAGNMARCRKPIVSNAYYLAFVEPLRTLARAGCSLSSWAVYGLTRIVS